MKMSNSLLVRTDHAAIPSWEETQKYLNSISGRGIRPGLERMRKIMAVFGHPEQKFQAIHVTGTNGKGSVCAMLESILRTAGYKTGFYSSPHLIDLNERITVAGKAIPTESICFWVDQIRTQAPEVEPELTYFELLTAIAFCYFAQENVEVAVVEVGLGGRLDSTNVIPPPAVCAITNVTLEHTEYLGNSIRKIAEEKAGIIKPDSVCVTGCAGTALRAVRKACKQLGVKAVGSHDVYKPSTLLKAAVSAAALKGRFQAKNIKMVLQIVQILKERKWAVSDADLIEGLRKVKWPGRYDWRRAPGTNLPVLLDGAHNPGAIIELLQALKKTDFHGKQCGLVVNVLKDKKVEEMMGRLVRSLKIKAVYIPALSTERSSDPQWVRSLVRDHKRDLAVLTFPSVKEAWKNLTATQEKMDWILVTGSLYLVGESLRWLSEQKKQGRNPLVFSLAGGRKQLS